jgi:lipoprotein-anchoring transpeptidase ErfK/SrfK
MSRGRILIAAGMMATVAVIGVAGALAVLWNQGSYQESRRYQQQHEQLAAQLQAATHSGYTSDDLQPIASGLASIDRATPPFWLGARQGFYQGQTAQLSQLSSQLKTLEQQLLQQSRDDAGKQVVAVTAAIAQDKQIEVPDSALAPVNQRQTTLAQAQGAAKNISDYRKLDQQAQTLLQDVKNLGAQQQQENQAIQQAAAALSQQAGNNLDAIRKAGQDALTNGRNDASIAAYEAKPGRFASINQLMDAYNRVEYYTARLGSADVSQVAFGAAAIQRYAAQVHQTLLQGLGPKHIIVSFQDQHVWAYANGQVVMETPATTGIRGATAYGTDFGPMKIEFRSHPWKMHSPFPKTSPYWYPDTVVQWTAFFTLSGESFHDASWEPDSQLGPGSQYNASTRSHGCIHVPYGDAQWMYNWAVENTPVDVYPGNGQPVSEQLSEMTTDDQGHPLNPA